MREIGLVGNGYLGKAYAEVFPEAYIYDEPKEMYAGEATQELGRQVINNCDFVIVAVPTDPLEDGSLDTSIVEEVVGWCEADTILIKSALMPGTYDRLVAETGKNLAVGVELIGMGNYYVDPSEYPDPKDPRKHKTIIVGGNEPARSKAAEYLWDKMQPDTKIHLISGLEAEITKLVENSYPAMKVSFINALYELAQKTDTNFLRIHQAWSSDSRVDGFHQRTTSFKRGWKSHCWDKDVPALARFAESVGADTMAKLFDTIVEINQVHLDDNEKK